MPSVLPELTWRCFVGSDQSSCWGLVPGLVEEEVPGPQSLLTVSILSPPPLPRLHASWPAAPFSPLLPTVHSQKQNRQTCVRKSLICAFAMAFIISVMLIAANQILRSGME